MAKNFDIGGGETSVIPALDTVESGDPIMAGGLVGVALTSAADVDEPVGIGTITAAWDGILYTRLGGSPSDVAAGMTVWVDTPTGNHIGHKVDLYAGAQADPGDKLFGYCIATNGFGADPVATVKVVQS